MISLDTTKVDSFVEEFRKDGSAASDKHLGRPFKLIVSIETLVDRDLLNYEITLGYVPAKTGYIVVLFNQDIGRQAPTIKIWIADYN